MRLLLVIRHAFHLLRVLYLPKNRQKGSWHSVSIHRLHTLACYELAELREEMLVFDGTPESYRRVASEAADLSAFAAMIADRCRVRVVEE